MNPFSQLNYHHLRYFWEVARHGSLRLAAEKLNVSQPTISAQVKSLEDALQKQLFNRSGRGLKLTPSGQMVMEYANDIFGLGTQMLEALYGSPSNQMMRLQVGITDSFSKLFAWNLIRPALREHAGLFLACTEGSSPDLLAQMVTGRLDMLLADEPAPSSLPIKAYSHLLGQTPVVFCAARELQKSLKGEFPANLNGAPMLLPAAFSAWRHQLDHWFDSQKIRPRVVAEFDDSALMKTAASDGLGILPIAEPVLGEVLSRFNLQALSGPQSCGFSSYIITVERALKHPAVQTIARAAQRVLKGAEGK